jgi:uncharacterized protein
LSFYLDASCCVATFTPESGSQRIAAWLEAHREAALATGAWAHVEVASALSLKVRVGSLTAGERTAVMAAWLSFREGLHNVTITESTYAAAAEMIARHDLGLRAGDSLHLAAAASAGCALVTFDQRLANAAPELGGPVSKN